MSAETLETPAAPEMPRLWRGWLVVAWAACTLALLPLFYAARWAGGEVGKYQLSTFESAAREALKQKDYASALKYCNGAIKAGHNHSEHWGRVFTLRSFAYVGQGRLDKAAAELIQAGDFFARRYYYAEEQDRREVPHAADILGKRLLKEGKKELALAVFSAGALASADPVETLGELAKSLTPAEKVQLWGKSNPYMLINFFLDAKENGPKQVVNDQGRSVGAPVLDAGVADLWARTARVDLGASSKDGICWLGLPTRVALSGRPFGILAHVKSDKPIAPTVLLSYWFESPQKSAMSEDASTSTTPDGWLRFDVRRDFLVERGLEATKNGYSPEGGIINQIGVSVPQGDAASLTFQPVQLYLPQG